MKLVIATSNLGKLAEYRELLAGLPYTVLSLHDYPEVGEIKETGSTFWENAAIKAELVAAHTGELTLADDSGLEVDALGGLPGVYSARFAGPAATDADNNAKLLKELKGIFPAQRTARFRAVVALAYPGEKTLFAEGVCEGIILEKPLGTGGFGYDPLFFLPELGVTFAQLAAAEKNKISHRALALAQLRQILQDLAAKEIF